MSDDKLSGEQPKLKGIDQVNAALERTKKKPREKLTQVQQFELIAKAISRDGPQGLPEFPVRLHVVEHVRGEPVIYEEMEGQVLQRRGLGFVTEQVLKYCSRVVPGRKFEFSAARARHAADYWYLRAQRLETEIAPVSQASDLGFTFHRLPWDLIPGDCPTWDEMFSRMQNAEAVMAFIGALFDPKADRQQYCWIYGDGGNGKSAISRFLHQVFNGAFRAEVVPSGGDKFWTSGLHNARIVVFGDCNNYNFPTTGLFKQITGSDLIKIEFKREAAFSAPLVCMMLFLSNKKPNIKGEQSDVRRAIYAEIAPINQPLIPTLMYDSMLFSEGAAFIYKCVTLYKKLAPKNGPIPVNESQLKQLVEDNEEEMEMLTLRNFEIEKTDQKKRLEGDRWFIAPCRLDSIFREIGITGDRRRYYLEYLKRRFQVDKKSVKVDGVVVKRYVGMREGADRTANEALGIIYSKE